MSLSFRDVPGFSDIQAGFRKAEIVGFAELKDADAWHQATLTALAGCGPYDVITFAAGLYYVVLITPDYVEATDGTEHNS